MTQISGMSGAQGLATNLSKAGAPMEFYAPAAFAIPPLGATRVALGLHVILPTSTEIVLQTRANLQRRGLTVTNPGLGSVHELTMLVTNASHTEQRVSRGACVARASLYCFSIQMTSTPAYYRSPSAVPRACTCQGEVVVVG